MRHSFIILLFFISCATRALALKPVHTYAMSPDTLGVKYEKNTIMTADGLHIKSWTLIPPDSLSNHTIVVMAGADAGNMSWFLMQGYYLMMNGYTVTLFDYRGFGESDSFPIDNKYLYYNEFEKDLAAVVDFERKRHPKEKVGVWAFSMGTIITSMLPQRLQPDFIIADSYVVNMQAVKKAVEDKKKEILLLPPGSDKYDTSLVDIKTPILAFAGTQDNITTTADVMKLKDRMPNMQVISYEGGHMAGFQVLSKEYFGSGYIAAINEFVNRLK